MDYTNRKGDVYILQAGKTKTGKPRVLVRPKADWRTVGRDPRRATKSAKIPATPS